jgi:hypothetical protein
VLWDLTATDPTHTATLEGHTGGVRSVDHRDLLVGTGLLRAFTQLRPERGRTVVVGVHQHEYAAGTPDVVG